MNILPIIIPDICAIQEAKNEICHRGFLDSLIQLSTLPQMDCPIYGTMYNIKAANIKAKLRPNLPFS
jgi:hypothetical protein